MSNKITVRSQFEAIREILVVDEQTELVEFIDGRIAQLDKKAASARSATHKPTAKQIENEGFKTDILAAMEEGKFYTSAEIIKATPSLAEAGVSVNRVGALMGSLAKAGTVVKTTEKGKSFYTLA